jgi:hypothetical protein
MILFSIETTYFGRFTSLIPPLLPTGLGTGGAICNGQNFSENTTKLAANIIQSDNNN